MKKNVLAVILIIFCMASTVRAQVSQEALDNARQEALQAKGKERSRKQKIYDDLLETARAENAVKAIEIRDFVLEADRITFKRGQWKFVTSTTNFISLSGDKATVQIAFEGAPPGPNGIGGITLEGNPSNVVIKTDKRGNTNFSMNVTGAAISARVEIRLDKDTYRATANVFPNFSSNRFTLTGYLWPRTESKVFKGRAF